MCRKKKKANITSDNKNVEKSLVFMNTPIKTIDDDIIGFSTHIQKIKSAIDSHAQMIAITSPFGAGKTSISELLQAEYQDSKNTKVIKVSMWSQLCNRRADTTGATDDLHRSLVYQIISQISHRRGKYVSKLLNPSYGVLRLYTNNLMNFVLIVIAALLFFFGYLLPEKFGINVPLLATEKNIVESIMLLTSITLAIITVMRSEIVFSSRKSESDRKIDSNDIMQIYRSEILGTKRKCNRQQRYIVIIEDLDRTDDGNAVVNFLKELRKYYIPDISKKFGDQYLNEVTFLVNIKPEALLCRSQAIKSEMNTASQEDQKGNGDQPEGEEAVDNSQETRTETEHLYAKLFDYTLNLQTINIDDYETILESLLEQKCEAIKNVGLKWQGKMLNIPGMQWIVRGEKLGIREIKDRLNISFSLYESLKAKFGEKVLFEQCAIVAYITTEYEEDFYKTDDRAYGEMVNLFLQKCLTKEQCDKSLPETSAKYRKEIRDLIASKRIDSNYRMYFYNYPKNSRIFTFDEAVVQKAILYGENTKNLSNCVTTILNEKSSVIADAFQTRKLLKLSLPDVVFQIDELYTQAIKLVFGEVIKWMEALDCSADAQEKTIGTICRILSFDAARTVYNKEQAKQFCDIWEDNMPEKELLVLRQRICKAFAGEVLWYRQLFEGVHKIINQEEMAAINIEDALQLINMDSTEFGINYVDYIVTRFCNETDNSKASLVEEFLVAAGEHISENELIPYYVRFMKKVVYIVPAFELELVNEIKDSSGENKEKLFREYQDILNSVDAKGLSRQSLSYINDLEYYDGYAEGILPVLEINKYYLSYVLQMVYHEKEIPAEEEHIVQTIKESLPWLILHPNHLLSLRWAITKETMLAWKQYAFLFGIDCPVITDREIETLQDKCTCKEILKLLQPTRITADRNTMLATYFNQKKQTNADSFAIMCFVAALPQAIAENLFYSLDFDMVRYRFLSKARKEYIKGRFKDALQLSTPIGRLKFMEATKHIDALWEKELLDDLKQNEDHRKQYIRIVNSIPKVTKNTIQTLIKLPKVHAMSQPVEEMYFECGMLEHYVVSRVLNNRAFVPEEGERKSVLWNVYIEIFKKGYYSNTVGYMAANKEFLCELANEKVYQQAEDDSALHFASIPQKEDYILSAFNRGPSFAEQYFQKVVGFADYEAAKCFVDQASGVIQVLKSDAVYQNTHEKLVDPQLKRKYTNNRKKLGAVSV